MQSIIVASLLATAVSANVNFMANPIMKRAALEPRATDAAIPDLSDISGECQTAILGLAKGIPTPAPEIMSDLLEHPQTDPCDFSTPASLSSEYKAYSSEIISWYGKNVDGIMSAVKECPEIASLASMVPICEATATDASSLLSAISTHSVPAVVTTHNSDAVKTPAATPTSGAPDAVETNGAVSREGGLLYVAAAAVAGV
ncbi:hypothetical protein ACLX1H_010220 [Fusarium chlamydosporum]